MKLKRSDRFIFLKLAEELNELSVELLQAVNKADKNNWGKICDEIADVENYINKIKKIREC